MTDVKTMFIKTIEVFNKIATKVIVADTIENSYQRIKYSVSQKQYDWLVKTYCQESKPCLFDGRTGVTVIDEEGNSYSFSPKNFNYNVPHFIPKREQYGKSYTIVKYVKQ